MLGSGINGIAEQTCPPTAAAGGEGRTRRACLPTNHHNRAPSFIEKQKIAARPTWQLVGVESGLDVDAFRRVDGAVGEHIEGAQRANAGEGKGVDGMDWHASWRRAFGEYRAIVL